MKLLASCFNSVNTLDSRVKCLLIRFKIIKGCTFHYLVKSVPISGNRIAFEILQLSDTWRYQNLVILFFSSALILNKLDGACLVKHHNTELDVPMNIEKCLRTAFSQNTSGCLLLRDIVHSYFSNSCFKRVKYSFVYFFTKSTF